MAFALKIYNEIRMSWTFSRDAKFENLNLFDLVIIAFRDNL